MPAIKPYYTSNDIISSVKRKISFPISQNTFTENDILAFANEEMFISQVPSVLQFHEDYFVTYITVPLQSNLSRYSIPDRATGMKLRDLFYQDSNGNLFEMTRFHEDDRAYFQAFTGSNQNSYGFYVQGNEITLTPGVGSSPTGSLLFVFYLRPNQLVKNDRAATISGFSQNIEVNNSLISVLDTITIGEDVFTAVSTLGGTITAITTYSTTETQITCTGHQLSSGQIITISGSNSNPLVNGQYVVEVLDANTFLINKEISVAGTAGTFTCSNQFQIGVSDSITASNLSSALNSIVLPNLISSSVSSNLVTVTFRDIYTVLNTTNTTAFIIPQEDLTIQFESLQNTYLNTETNQTEDLFINGELVDFLQTKPGHKTYKYDVLIPPSGISGNSITFLREELLVPTGSIISSTSPTGMNAIAMQLPSLMIGDYMCLANEAIIPQIPPDLHNGLAERTAARILAAIGDQQGLQSSMAKIQEIDAKQGNLLDNRVEGAPVKVLNRHSPLRYGKLGRNRRL